MKLEFHPLTASDLNKAAAYYNEKRMGLGDRFRSEVYSAIERILTNPKLFRIVSEQKRRCIVSRFPYSVIFRVVGDDTIRILVIRHHRRRPEFGADRS